MSYYYGTSGIKRDELLAGPEVPTYLSNITVGEAAVIERGMLMAADSLSGEYSLVSNANAASKVLAVASEDFIADENNRVTQAYRAGLFNRERIKLGGGLTVDPFEQELRKQNIHLTRVV